MGLISGFIGGRTGIKSSHASIETPAELNWKQPQELVSEQVAQIAYDGYKDRSLGCCHGAFKGLAGPILEKMGPPYNAFPLEVMRVGKCGIAETGSICGALLGADYAFHLFFDAKTADEIIKELHRWYGQALLPMYKPVKANYKDYDVPKTVAVITECHASVDTWIRAAGFVRETDERRERCDRVTADVAIKATEIWNAVLDKKPFKLTSYSEKQQKCGSCHFKGIIPEKKDPKYMDARRDVKDPPSDPGKKRFKSLRSGE